MRKITIYTCEEDVVITLENIITRCDKDLAKHSDYAQAYSDLKMNIKNLIIELRR